MVDNIKNKEPEGGSVEERGKEKGPLMILSSGKVVGNPKEQWKEVKDNRVKNVTTQKSTQGTTRKEIVPVNKGVGQQAPRLQLIRCQLNRFK